MSCNIYLHKESAHIAREQREINQYLKDNHLKADRTVEDTNPAKLHWTERPIHDLIKSSTAGDTIILFEASHIACSTSQMLEILNAAATRKVAIHFVKYNVQVNNDTVEINTQHLLNIISKIESDFVSKRTSQALARRKAAGLPLGRPKGRGNKSLKLDKFRAEIEKYLTLGISKASIAKLVDCHPQTLYDWLERKENRSTDTTPEDLVH
jgi:DNA invertase Pin-like site-specific DNA recombinase